MAFTSRTILSRRAVDSNGVILFEFAKQVLNGDTVISSEDHLLSVPPVMADGTPPDWDYIKNQVDAHLDGLGFAGTTTQDWGRVTDFATAVVTPDVVQDYVAKQEAAKDKSVADQAVQNARGIVQ